MILLLAACSFLTATRPPEGPVPRDGAVATSVEPVSFAPLEERVNVLIAGADDADRRDRLFVMRELMLDLRNSDPATQRKIYIALERLLTIEERASPQPLPMDAAADPIESAPIESLPIESVPLEVGPVAAPPSVEPARKALAEARYLDAIAALAGIDTPDAVALRKEAIDAWARQERERAGHLFLEARDLGPGAERAAAMRKARQVLVDVNERFPNNAYGAQIRDNIAKIDAELAKLQ